MVLLFLKRHCNDVENMYVFASQKMAYLSECENFAFVTVSIVAHQTNSLSACGPVCIRTCQRVDLSARHPVLKVSACLRIDLSVC